MEAQHAYNNGQRRDETDAQIIFCTSNVHILLSAHSTDQKRHSSCLLIHTELPAECLLLCTCVCGWQSVCISVCLSIRLCVCLAYCMYKYMSSLPIPISRRNLACICSPPSPNETPSHLLLEDCIGRVGTYIHVPECFYILLHASSYRVSYLSIYVRDDSYVSIKTHTLSQ